MTIEAINPDTLYDGSATGMSHAKVDTDIGLVFVSGQVDWNKDYKIENRDMKAQAKGAAKNLITVLEAAGSAVENILQLRIYVRGEVADHMEAIMPVIAQYLCMAKPALTGIGVQSLASPDMLIEIEAVAKVVASTRS